jgi:GT2 family glycosyltransferase
MSISTDPIVVSLSIVSHGQGNLVKPLLQDIQRWSGASFQILLTLNIPEDQSFLEYFSDLNITLICNSSPKGFGSNHNAAFHFATGEIFVILNPDIRAPLLDINPLLETISYSKVGACAPAVFSVKGEPEDSARHFPSFLTLVNRVISNKRHSDYQSLIHPIEVDWVAGMFVMFRADVFRLLGGFDERYFMYMEDADICRRLNRLNYLVVLDPRCRVTHDARRSSRKHFRYMIWHLKSALRFLFGR